MVTSRLGTATAMVTVMALGACSAVGGGSSSPTKSAGTETVSSHPGKLGRILTGGQGKTLYLFEKDKTTTSTCEGPCAKAWPLMVVKDGPDAGEGVQDALLDTSPRGDGQKQVTYQGHPLYYHGGDDKPGKMNGQELNQFGGKWYAVDTDGEPVTSTPDNSGSAY